MMMPKKASKEKKYDKNSLILNIFHMLAYTVKDLNDFKYSTMFLAEEELKINKEYLSILATFLKRRVALQLGRGLSKGYVEQTLPLSTLRGKVDISSSIKQRTMMQAQLICHFDEFTENIIFNQIIKTTFLKLLKILGTSHSLLKKDIRNLLMRFNNVDEILDVKNINWNMSYNRNNQSNKIIMVICKLILENDIIPVNEKNSREYEIKPLFNDDLLAKLFENFLLEFYKRNIHGEEGVKVHPLQKELKWARQESKIEANKLPKMLTDVYISNKEKKEVYIIDAKFYKTILEKRKFNDK